MQGVGRIIEVIANPLVDQYLQDGDHFSEDQSKMKSTVGTNSERYVEGWLVCR